LAASASRPCASPPASLPERIAAGVAQLNVERRRAFAQNPFSLFDAKFGDGAFWTQLTGAVREPTVCAIDSQGGSGMNGFNQLALFYAWHLARSDALAARILLGMSKRTQAIFAQLSLPYLQQLARAEPQLIVPRWSDRDTVWQILLGAARLGPAHLAEIRMFGIQLIAGDLLAISEG
jgi:hypothetical protein